MKSPFFTVVIPTKNRPFYLRQAIQSVLLQDFEDYELLVSDNFNGEETREVISEFSSVPRFRSVRTDHEMNMIDHWEWATKHAQGRYVLVLPDRKLFFQHALRKLSRCIQKQEEQFNIYSFAIRMFDERLMKIGYTRPKGHRKTFSSPKLIENFIHCNYYSKESYDQYFPKTMNSCYKNEFASSVRGHFGKYFNQPGVTTPDYSSMMINLALNDTIFYLAEYCILTQGEQVSNGRLFSTGQYQAYMKSLKIDDPFELLPCHVYSSYNLNMNDFLRIKAIVKGNLENYSLDVKNYFATIYTDLLLKEFILGALNSVVKQMMKEFNDDVERLPLAQRLSVKEACEAIKEEFGGKPRRKITQDTLPFHVNDFFYMRLHRFPKVARSLKLMFSNGLQAAGFKNLTGSN